ncbi:MAG: hypothetical protein IT208_06430 [Chthonomonadales bacterium]|nr:hypothetical protein [Chthonomonadales bacterium]
MNRSPRPRGAERGAVLIAVLFAIVVATMLLVGVSTLAVSHLDRAMADARYSAALDAAEAGINAELRSLSAGNSADVADSPATGTLGAVPWLGAFSAFCANVDGSAIDDPDSLPSTILIRSVGSVDGVSRTVQIRARKGSGDADYAVFAKRQGTINGAQTVDGSVGTSGSLLVNGSNTITGGPLGLHGDTATATINPAGRHQTERREPIDWPTVEEVANERFPFGGLTWLSTSNDNNLASAYVSGGQLNGHNYSRTTVSPAVVNSKVSANGTGTLTFHGKAGGANYYLNGLTVNGNWTMVFDNTDGPINIWCKASGGGTASFTVNGGNASVSMSEDPSKACRIYAAERCNLTLNGNDEGRYGVYAVNDSMNGGNVTFNGNNDLYGAVIANTFTFNGSNTITYTGGYFSAGDGFWEMDGVWAELNPR